MPMLLVADDSELDRMVIVELLKKEPLDWLVEQVASAEEAVRLMKEIAFDVVITDVLMAGMSGLELLNYVHRQPRRVPVIVVSGQDTRDAAIAALQNGATNYIPKQSLPALLGETVRQVLDVATAEKNYQRLISTAEDMRFHFKLTNDLTLIHPLVSMIQQMALGMSVLSAEDCTRLGIAVDEAISNAMCHGNLELSADDMSYVRSHLHDKRPIEVVEKRRVQAPYDSRFVYVACLLTQEGVKVSVRDDGKGFTLSSIDHEQSGRGVTLIQNLVDKATFNEAGNELTLLKRTASPDRPPLNKAS
jgi:DNA-binding NarL/FixJ family response regulator/anti-sigma regulatory factor (Ser/Thr protein kinase)